MSSAQISYDEKKTGRKNFKSAENEARERENVRDFKKNWSALTVLEIDTAINWINSRKKRK